jgi:hypothetical protein
MCQLRALLLAGDNTDRKLARGRLADTALAAPARRRCHVDHAASDTMVATDGTITTTSTARSGPVAAVPTPPLARGRTRAASSSPCSATRPLCQPRNRRSAGVPDVVVRELTRSLTTVALPLSWPEFRR